MNIGGTFKRQHQTIKQFSAGIKNIDRRSPPVGNQEISVDVIIHPIGSAGIVSGQSGEQPSVGDLARRGQVIRPQRLGESLRHDQQPIIGPHRDAVAERIPLIQQMHDVIVGSAKDLPDGCLRVGAGRRGEIEILVFVKRAVVAPADRLAIT